MYFNRIISDHGKEARFPFLDEGVVGFLNSLPIWKKVLNQNEIFVKVPFYNYSFVQANLYQEKGIGDKLLLRLAAIQLGLQECSLFVKRAIQVSISFCVETHINSAVLDYVLKIRTLLCFQQNIWDMLKVTHKTMRKSVSVKMLFQTSVFIHSVIYYLRKRKHYAHYFY